jgi:hypothetical protein
MKSLLYFAFCIHIVLAGNHGIEKSNEIILGITNGTVILF